MLDATNSWSQSAEPTAAYRTGSAKLDSIRFRRELAKILPELRLRALRHTRNEVEAEDLLQETVLRALRFEESFRVGTNLKAWLSQVLFSVFISRCRKLKRERKAMEGFGADPTLWFRGETEIVLTELTPSVQAAMSGIQPLFAEVVRLIDLQQLSYQEAADRLEVPVGTVMSRLFRGRKLLAALLQSDALQAA